MTDERADLVAATGEDWEWLDRLLVDTMPPASEGVPLSRRTADYNAEVRQRITRLRASLPAAILKAHTTSKDGGSHSEAGE